jgi:cytidylate kinase
MREDKSLHGTLCPLIIAIDGPSASGKGTIARKLAAHFGFAYLDTGLLYRAVGMAVLRTGGDLGNAEAAEKAALALAAGIKGNESSCGSPPSPTLPPPTPRSFGATSVSDRAEALAEAGARGRESTVFATIDFPELLNDPALRGDEASAAASKVAAVPAVRAALLKFQKDFCAAPPQGKKGAVLDGRDIGTVIAPGAAVKIFVTAGAEARALRRFKELQARGENAAYAAVLADMKERDARDAGRAVAPTKPAPDAIVLDTTEIDAGQAFAEAVRITEEKMGFRHN